MSEARDDLRFEEMYQDDLKHMDTSNVVLQIETTDHPMSEAKDDKWFEQSY